MKTAKIIVEVAAADKDFTDDTMKSIQSEILSTCRMMFKDNGFIFDIKEEAACQNNGFWGYAIKKEKVVTE